MTLSLRFVEEFVVKPPKEIGRDIHQEEEEVEAFVPQYLFEALKENKRFDTMKVKNISFLPASISWC
jgi:hypothetical protein